MPNEMQGFLRYVLLIYRLFRFTVALFVLMLGLGCDEERPPVAE